MDARLVDIVRLARVGERDAALQHLRAYLDACPGDADAWVVLSGLAPDARIALAALRRAVALDPGHEVARRRLAEMAGAQAGGMPAVEEESAPPPVQGAEEDDAFQIVRDARALIWPFVPRGVKRRPLGELLDERQITRQDLLWASVEAQSEDVRVASNVLLDAVHHLPDVAMSPEEARLISWPFRRLNRPLGELVDAGMVRVKDLRRAAWFAKDARLREAARMLLPAATAQREAFKRRRAKQKAGRQAANVATSEKPRLSPARIDAHPSRPMPIVQGSRYLADEVQRRGRRQVAVAAAAVALAIVVPGVLLASVARGLLAQELQSVWLLPLVAASLWLFYGLWNRFAELRHEGRNFRQGQLGEARVAQQLRNGLGSDWTLFRNVELPGSHVDIDMVLLGPPGIFTLEVKAYTGDFRYRKQHFYRRTRVGWRKMQHNPGKQARAGGGLLHNYIAQTLNREVWVEPHLVWVGPGSLQLRDPEVYVWFFDSLDQETARLRGLAPRLSTEDQAALSGLLRGLCSTLR